MLSLAIAVAISASIMRAASTLNESRLKPEYFTRKRKLPFQKLLKYLLSMHKSSTQSALNNFLEREDITMSQQALSKARSKFDHTPFLKLFTAVRDAFYGAEYIDNLRKYHNKFLIAIDGSDTALPNLPSLIEKFGGTGSKSSSPTARMSIAYDVLNDFIIDAAFTPLNVSEREHAKNHIESVGKIIDLKNSIFIMDRGYASQELIEIFSEKSYYLFRLRTKFNNDIDALPIGSHVISMYDNLKVRIVKFALPSCEIETLITNLFDLDESEFKELYFKRWRIEVEYDVVKNKLELPCFGGFSENIPRQCLPSKAMKAMVIANPDTIISIHNHPNSSVPSLDDINSAWKKKYKYGIIACHNGNLYKYKINGDYNALSVDMVLDRINSSIYNRDIGDCKSQCDNILIKK